MTHPTLAQTEALVREKFAGQQDRAGVPMVDHMRRVASHVHDEDEMTLHIAWLHDIIEDTDMDASQLKSLGYDDIVIDAVELLTHDKKQMTYPEYIDRICSSGNIRAIKVKLADQRDNTDPSRQMRLNRYIQNALRKKYAGVQLKLMEAAKCLISTSTC